MTVSMNYLQSFIRVRNLKTSCVICKEVLKNLKGKKTSSQEWLKRQFSDPYVEKAKSANYRCRSAFKLIEIDDRYKILSPGYIVIDCGAAPGSWTQVAVTRTNADGKDKRNKVGTVIGLDLKPIFPIEGATLLGNSDITSQETKNKILQVLDERNQNKREVDVVLSDMAPNATGVKSMDHSNIINLVYDVVRFALTITNINGSLLVKLWEGSETIRLQNDLSRFYNVVRYVKPNASRSDSTEIFILATGFKGIKR